MSSRYTDETQLRDVLEQFSGLVQTSEVFRRESRNGRYSSHCFSAVLEVRQPQGAFFFLLEQGTVLAGAGMDRREAQRAAMTGKNRAVQPTLSFNLSADTLDEVLSGSIHPVQLAFTGRVRVSGNVLVALGLQALLPEAIRLYRKITRAR